MNSRLEFTQILFNKFLLKKLIKISNKTRILVSKYWAWFEKHAEEMSVLKR